MRAAHGTEVRGLRTFLRESLLSPCPYGLGLASCSARVFPGRPYGPRTARGDGVEAKVELIFPAELARLRLQPRPVGLSVREILVDGTPAARIAERIVAVYGHVAITWFNLGKAFQIQIP